VEEGSTPALPRVSESVFSVANEFMGVAVSLTKVTAGITWLGSYFNHLYEMMDIHHDQIFKGFVTQGAAMLNAVDWLYTRLWVDGEQLDLAKSKFSGFTRKLGYAPGYANPGICMETAGGKKTEGQLLALHGYAVNPSRLPAHYGGAAEFFR